MAEIKEVKIKLDFIVISAFTIIISVIAFVVLFTLGFDISKVLVRILVICFSLLATIVFNKYYHAITNKKALESEVRKWRSLAEDKKNDIYLILKWCQENKVNIPDYLLRELEVYDGNWEKRYPAPPNRSFHV